MSIKCSAANRYPALDALRGAAAFAVLLYHLRNIGPGSNNVFEIFSSGYLAVDLFFALSGFVISHAYEHRLSQGLTVRKFILARFVRLQPMIATGTLLGFTLACSQRAMQIDGAPGLFEIFTTLPANLMMLPNIFVPWGIFLFNPPAWSLFYEMIANTAYALLLRMHTVNGVIYKKFTLIISTICLAGALGVIASVLTFGDLDHGVELDDWPVAFSRITFSFTLGVLLQRTNDMWSAKIYRVSTFYIIFLCLVLLFPNETGSKRAVYDLLFVFLASPTLIIFATSATFSSKTQEIYKWIGTISYPLYAIHAPIKHLIESTIDSKSENLFYISISTSIITAVSLHKTYPKIRDYFDKHMKSIFTYKNILNK